MEAKANIRKQVRYGLIPGELTRHDNSSAPGLKKRILTVLSSDRKFPHYSHLFFEFCRLLFTMQRAVSNFPCFLMAISKTSIRAGF
jgi:hypothetical protein